jgi:hypothetical protein
VAPRIAELWRGILMRRPSWRAIHELRRHLGAADVGEGALEALRSELLEGGRHAAAVSDGELRVDLAAADSGPYDPLDTEGQLIVGRRDGTLDATPVLRLLARLPALVVVGRVYERAEREPATG